MAPAERDGNTCVADLLRRYRRSSGLSQAELARRAGYSGDYISMLERGVRAPSSATIGLLADALELDPARKRELATARGGSDRGPTEAAAPDPSRDHTPLAGRRVELAALREHLAGMGPATLLVSSQPGMGKTRLLAEAASLAPGMGMAVLAASRRCGARREPFSPLLEALAGAIHACPARRLGALLEGCDWLVRLLPELSEVGLRPPPEPLSARQERRLAFRAAARFLANAAGPGGSLLLLDNLHWAGSDALDLLGYLLQSTAPIRVIGAYRDSEVSPRHPLAFMRADLLASGQARELPLGPLSDADSRELLRAMFAGTVVSALHTEHLVSRTGGVPLYLVGLAQGLLAGTGRSGRHNGVPPELLRIIGQRVGSLPEPAQELLRVAAAAGDDVERPLLAAVAAQPEGVALAAIEALCGAGLLVEDSNDRYRFAQPLVREVVQAQMGGARRSALQRRIQAGRKWRVASDEWLVASG